MIWLPETLADALCVECEADAGDDFIDRMVIANAASVDWTLGKLDTGTYLEVIEENLEVDPIEFVNSAVGLYLPKRDFV